MFKIPQLISVSQFPTKLLTLEFKPFTTFLYVPKLIYDLVSEIKTFLEQKIVKCYGMQFNYNYIKIQGTWVFAERGMARRNFLEKAGHGWPQSAN